MYGVEDQNKESIAAGTFSLLRNERQSRGSKGRQLTRWLTVAAVGLVLTFSLTACSATWKSVTSHFGLGATDPTDRTATSASSSSEAVDYSKSRTLQSLLDTWCSSRLKDPSSATWPRFDGSR